MTSNASAVGSLVEVSAFNDELSLLAATLILTFGVFGVTTNLSIALIFYKEKSERTAFNLICVFRAVSNVIILSATFLLVFFAKLMAFIMMMFNERLSFLKKRIQPASSVTNVQSARQNMASTILSTVG
ncbi:hypothetical protein L3Y34_007873 [Caenorhabditis briggsae]|uniref:7TM GPCR serpentine receptor class x (Srx) domain-containing protein n=1 Tax=Caenorhabditis briggsae TaxID=6238 RepID=A0AAE9A7L7_CAEBR|nr:hypothetical protein L3Y34_007873 [Caenorhabditis briggsae]